jgi:hypothetical protein
MVHTRYVSRRAKQTQPTLSGGQICYGAPKKPWLALPV